MSDLADFRLRRAAWLIAALASFWALAGCGSSAPASGALSGGGRFVIADVSSHPASGWLQAQRAPGRPAFKVGERVLTFIDHSRLIRLSRRRPQPRRLVTVVRYPEGASGPFPLVVFGHGFAVTPAYYFRLLTAWAQAGYVVAAPVFPLGNAHAPGGPDEADIVNQPGDMSFVITRMVAASADPRSPLAGLVNPGRIAVSGQSDGGETALAVAYDRYYLDRRVRAAIILSGAQIPGGGGFDFPASSPPLLATQGTADTINEPRFTYAFFNIVPRPKYLLKLLGAGHLPPYTSEQPQLSIVERVTIAFMDRYLKGVVGAVRRLHQAGDIAGTSELDAEP